jgi:hypothetical protein
MPDKNGAFLSLNSKTMALAGITELIRVMLLSGMTDESHPYMTHIQFMR